jgi:hypothetical protein
MANRHRDKGRRPKFTMVYDHVMQSAAWKVASIGARLLFIALKSKYSSNFGNNGSIFLSSRHAAQFGLGHSSVSRWYRELQHCGFIEMITAAHLGIEGNGKAARWRITDKPYNGDPPTNDFLRWDGALFDEPEKQNPEPTIGSHCTDHWFTGAPTVGSPPCQSARTSGS